MQQGLGKHAARDRAREACSQGLGNIMQLRLGKPAASDRETFSKGWGSLQLEIGLGKHVDTTRKLGLG